MKRVWIAVVVFCVALAGLVGWQFMKPSKEPVYNGRPLSFWLEPVPSAGGEPFLRKAGDEEAIRQTGTNAIPTLLRLLRARDSILKRTLMALVNKQHLMKITIAPAIEWNGSAVMGFSVLGTNAVSAVPALMEIAHENISLESRMDAIVALGYVGPSAKAAVPLLLCFATNSNRDVRDVTMSALGQILVDADRVVPVLASSLRDPDSAVQQGAAIALRRYGPEARAAVPELLKYLYSADQFYKPSAEDALLAVAPDVAAKAGITNAPLTTSRP